jgi:hypothetical protein
MLKSRFSISAALVLAVLSGPGHAAIYKYIDSDGNVTFTDKYRHGAVKFADTPDGPSTIVIHKHGKTSTRPPSPVNFPKVDSATQHKRDDIRRTLLEEERRKEEQNLATAKALQAGTARRSPGEQEKMAENVRLHEKNIEMLDRELAHTK